MCSLSLNVNGLGFGPRIDSVLFLSAGPILLQNYFRLNVLVALHGGSGVPHDYIENLVDLASDSRRVILYDQLGCGRSDQPDDTSLWRIERFVEELGIVRGELSLDKIHLLGQSWGGKLAIEYALTQPHRNTSKP